jgi:hypothetical protein
MFFSLSVQNVEDIDLWGFSFWHITLICILCQRTQIWGNIHFGGDKSEYDYIYICKTRIRVWPKICVITSYSDPCPSKALSPQICVLWCHTQIYVLSKTYLLRSVSSDVILRSMSSKIYVPSGHGSEFDVMVGHGFEGRTRVWVLHIYIKCFHLIN